MVYRKWMYEEELAPPPTKFPGESEPHNLSKFVGELLEALKEEWRNEIPEIDCVTTSDVLNNCDVAAHIAHLTNWTAKIANEEYYDLKGDIVQYAAGICLSSGWKDDIVYIDTPEGQVSFHMFDDELRYIPERFELVKSYPGEWSEVPTQEDADIMLSMVIFRKKLCDGEVGKVGRIDCDELVKTFLDRMKHSSENGKHAEHEWRVMKHIVQKIKTQCG